jgi:hypothetical protein
MFNVCRLAGAWAAALGLAAPALAGGLGLRLARRGRVRSPVVPA